MSSAEAIAARFESVFANIRDMRMQGVPILNDAMPVKAVGFREWGVYWLGVMVTPWFMNLVLVPRENTEVAWPSLAVTERQTHTLPSGEYEFLLSEEDGLGRYQMCSLFSPMFEFENAQAAIATAEAVMAAIFETPSKEAEGSEAERTLEMPARPAPAAVSRRALLFGQPDTGTDIRRGKATSTEGAA